MPNQNNDLSELRQELKNGLEGIHARFDTLDGGIIFLKERMTAFNEGLMFVAKKFLADSELRELRAILEEQVAHRARKVG